MSGKRIYIAGPYSSDPEINTRHAIWVADCLLRAGLVPFVPHLSHFWHQERPHPYEDWMGYVLAWLPQCQALLRLKGESPGADREVAEAIRYRLPVFYHIENLLLAYGKEPEIKAEPMEAVPAS